MTPKTDRIIGRVMAFTLLACSITFCARTGTTVINTIHKPDVVCGIGGCSGNNPSGVKGGHGGAGGGTIKVGV
jgi:hypothetical protein